MEGGDDAAAVVLQTGNSQIEIVVSGAVPRVNREDFFRAQIEPGTLSSVKAVPLFAAWISLRRELAGRVRLIGVE
jgi:hypothetical protein